MIGAGTAMVRIVGRDREWEIRAGMTVRDMILKLGLDPESQLAVRDGKLISDATLTRDGDVIRLVPVISGG